MNTTSQFSVYSSGYLKEPSDALLIARRQVFEEAYTEHTLHEGSVIIQEFLEQQKDHDKLVFTFSGTKLLKEIIRYCLYTADYRFNEDQALRQSTLDTLEKAREERDKFFAGSLIVKEKTIEIVDSGRNVDIIISAVIIEE